MSGQRTEYADLTCSLSVLPVTVASAFYTKRKFKRPIAPVLLFLFDRFIFTHLPRVVAGMDYRSLESDGHSCP